MHSERFFRYALSLTWILIACLYGCSVKESPVRPETETEAGGEEAAPDPFLRGVVTVQFDEETTLQVEKALSGGEPAATRAPQLGGMGIKSMRRVFPDAGEYEERTRREGLHRFYYVEFDEETAPTRAAAGFRELPGVVSVTPQLPVRLRAFNDPYFSSQWHYVNGRYQGADINVQKVWDEFTVGSSSVIVSVVDEGVNMQHPDLAANLIPCLEDGTGSFNFNNNTPTVVPTQGHGTHVAGIISAVSNNGIGVAGVAGGDAAAGIPGVRVLSCQIFDLYGNSPDLYQAIKHGADHGAVILQCSWGFSPDLDGDGFTTDEEIELYRSFTINDLPEYKAAIDYFIKYAGCDNNGNQLPDSPMKGGVAIFAAGNDNFDYDPLVSYEPIIAVGAFGATGNKASYSNYGDWVDIAAPGGDAKFGIYSTLLGSSYGGSDWQGTSMACPHVSGVAALLVSYFGGPGFTAQECRTRILRGAVSRFISGSRYIGRKLDAYGAFTFDVNAPVQAPVLSWAGTPPDRLHYREVVEVPLSVTDPRGEEVWVSLSPEQEGMTLVGDADEGYRIRLDAAAIGKGSHTVTVKARNEDQAISSLTLSFLVLDNQAPALSGNEPASLLVDAPGTTVSIPLGEWFTDPDADPLSFEVKQGEPALAEVSVSEEGTLTLKALQYGLSSLTVQASDGQASVRKSLPLAVRNPAAAAYVYPTRASNSIHVAVDAASPTEIALSIRSDTGAEVYSGTVEGDLFHPVTLYVKGFAPGRYTVVVTCSGKTHRAEFVRI